MPRSTLHHVDVFDRDRSAVAEIHDEDREPDRRLGRGDGQDEHGEHLADELERLVTLHDASTIAAVIVEPLAGSTGVLVPPKGYLQRLRTLCDKHGILLIFDEVMTGFRFGTGGVQGFVGITPDITCLGKVIGGGMPVGAFGGRKDVMQFIAPTGPVYQAGTLSGNPIAMSAGLAQMDALCEPGLYEALAEKTKRVAQGFKAAADKHGIPLSITYAGGMFGFFFTEDTAPMTSFAQVTQCNMEHFRHFYHAMLDEGVYLAPSAYEAGFLSMAHGDEEIEYTLAAVDRVFAAMK